MYVYNYSYTQSKAAKKRQRKGETFMSKAQGSSRKALVIGIIAAVVVLGALLAVLLTQCAPAAPTQTAPSTTAENVIETYDIYWNIDRAE